MIELDYINTKSLIYNKIKLNSEIVLSTSYQNMVTSRTMCYVFMDDIFYFLTSIRSTKCKQIEKNPYVSLCLDNIQIEGTSKIIGHPSIVDENVVSIFNETHKDYFNRFAHFKAAVFFEIQPSKLKVWNLKDDKYFYHLDLKKQKAYRTR